MELVDGASFPLKRILDHLREDSTRNLFAIYDLLEEPENTTTSLAIEEGRILGYLLRYSGLAHPTAIIRGSRPAVARLLDEVQGQKMVLFLDSEARDMAEERLNPTSVIPEDLMVVGPNGAKLPTRNPARRLGPGDAPGILALYSDPEPTRENPEMYAKCAEKHVVFGVFRDDKFASVAGTWTETEEGWIVGGVYTSPPHRGRGFASMATSAVTREALKNARQSTLFVVSSNEPAIRVYERLCYRKVGERLWVDLGTGIKPLTTES
jgi:ribosomal protein S18 acetylase RimI-like enzyme